jgi:hypothetical protein
LPCAFIFSLNLVASHEKINRGPGRQCPPDVRRRAQTVPAPQIAARSWLLLDATSGQIIASQDPDARIEPASLTKVMTAYVTFGAIRDKKIDAGPDGQRVGARPGRSTAAARRCSSTRPPRSRSTTCCTA